MIDQLLELEVHHKTSKNVPLDKQELHKEPVGFITNVMTKEDGTFMLTHTKHISLR